MKYLCLIYNDEREMGTMPRPDGEKMMAEYSDFTESIKKSGHYKGGDALQPTATATTASYLTLLAVCVAPLLVWLGREAPFGYRTVRSALMINPVAAALQAADAPGFVQYELLPTNWWIIGSACAILLVFLSVRTWQLYQPE